MSFITATHLSCFLLSVIFFRPISVYGQSDLQKPFKDCNVQGSTTIYDLKNNHWIFTDSSDAVIETLPASTFKIINLLIALETGVIKNENTIIKWVGNTDTSLYGYRPEIYKDMSVKKAFEVSAGWVFIELAKKIGRERYRQFLDLSHYGNGNISDTAIDFWNFGDFAISPMNQVQFLISAFKGNTPFSKKNIEILKKVMVTEKNATSTIRSKTGWTREDGKDWGWWVGYIEHQKNTYFFATRIAKNRTVINKKFSQCRKDITKQILRKLKMHL